MKGNFCKGLWAPGRFDDCCWAITRSFQYWDDRSYAVNEMGHQFECHPVTLDAVN